MIIETEDGVDLIPATIELARAEADLLTRTGREHVLKGVLDDLADSGRHYDWVLLDCPPSLGVLTVAALTAADGVLIPLQCETLSHRGVGQLLDTVHDVRRFTNRDLEVWGVLPTLYDGRTNHARTVLETISETYDLEVIEPPIPKTIRFAEAPAEGRSILRDQPRSKGAKAYREVAAAPGRAAGRGRLGEPAPARRCARATGGSRCWSASAAVTVLSVLGGVGVLPTGEHPRRPPRPSEPPTGPGAATTASRAREPRRAPRAGCAGRPSATWPRGAAARLRHGSPGRLQRGRPAGLAGRRRRGRPAHLSGLGQHVRQPRPRHATPSTPAPRTPSASTTRGR